MLWSRTEALEATDLGLNLPLANITWRKYSLIVNPLGCGARLPGFKSQLCYIIAV